MSYTYSEHSVWLASPAGIKAVGEVLANIESKLSPAGAANMAALWPRAGDTDQMMAAVDRAVELGVIEEVALLRTPWGQHRIFRKPFK